MKTQTDATNLSPKDVKALAKARRPWYMKKRFWLLGVVAVIAIIMMANGGSKDGDNPETESAAKLFPGRADSQREDQERNIGGAATLSGYTATLTTGGFEQKLSEIEDNGYIVTEVSILNGDTKAQSYNLLDWKLQTPGGQVVDPTFGTVDGMLGSGDLIGGGNVAGKIVFDVGTEKGDYYVIYKPDPFDSARGVWKVTI